MQKANIYANGSCGRQKESNLGAEARKRAYRMKLFTKLFGASLLFATVAQAQPLHGNRQFTHQDTLRGTLNPYRTWWDVQHYAIEVTPDFDKRSISGKVSIGFRQTAANWTSEIVGTFLLILIVSALLSRSVGASGNIPTGLAPYLVGMVVWSIGLSLGGTTGYAINPARDLGPRLAHAVLPIAGKGGSDWGYALIPVAGPAIGAVLAALAILLIGV
ncbi:MAG: hypothetical protein EOP67_30695 [Sphingomonas sp.]|nr:MAG: hypothetical protein EOP67_30695 [Sphingomonas sp.]